jgi:hypothetical protein
MAQQKRTTPRKRAEPERVPEVKALPFPGESPTVSLAMAAARMYGLPEEEQKPAAAAPKRRGAAKKKKPATAGGRAKTPAKRGGARARA